MRYHGGKFRLAPWIVSHFPSHRIYVEPFGGAASVLMHKSRSYAEVYNDLDDEIVNAFRVLRDPSQAKELERLIRLTPFSRIEFELSYESTSDPLEQARRTMARSFMGFGSASVNRAHRTGFRAKSWRSNTGPATDWQHWPDYISDFTSRLQGVVIESREADSVFDTHDGSETLFYVDPPYPFETRHMPVGAIQPHCYKHEMTTTDHESLAAKLIGLEAMVVLSGYRCELYDRLFAGWFRVDKSTFASGNMGAVSREESLWLNPACSAATSQVNMFDALTVTQ